MNMNDDDLTLRINFGVRPSRRYDVICSKNP